MKLLLSIPLFFIGSMALSQEYDVKEDEVSEIIETIAKAIEKEDYEELSKHLVFPFEVEDDTYTKSQLEKAFKSVFVEGTVRCLSSSGSYQVALPGNHTWYMAVCYSAPEGYDVSVFTFKKKENGWVLTDIDLQKDEY